MTPSGTRLSSCNTGQHQKLDFARFRNGYSSAKTAQLGFRASGKAAAMSGRRTSIGALWSTLPRDNLCDYEGLLRPSTQPMTKVVSPSMRLPVFGTSILRPLSCPTSKSALTRSKISIDVISILFPRVRDPLIAARRGRISIPFFWSQMPLAAVLTRRVREPPTTTSCSPVGNRWQLASSERVVANRRKQLPCQHLETYTAPSWPRYALSKDGNGARYCTER